MFAPVASSSLPYVTTSLSNRVTVCASGSSLIALVRLRSSTLFSVNHPAPPSSTSSCDFSPPRKLLETAVRSYGGSGSRETTRVDPSAPSSRSVRAAENPASPPPMIRKSTSGTFELRFAFLAEGREPLGRVGRLEQAGDALPLAGQCVGDRLLDARVGRELDLADRDRGAGGERLGVRARALGDLRSREQPVEDPEAVRLAGRDRAAGDHQIQRLRHPDDPRQPLRAAVAGQKAERHLRHAELVAAARAEAQVTGQRDLQPAAERVPFDLGDEHLRDAG